jgi:hypothetical protein
MQRYSGEVKIAWATGFSRAFFEGKGARESGAKWPVIFGFKGFKLSFLRGDQKAKNRLL